MVFGPKITHITTPPLCVWLLLDPPSPPTGNLEGAVISGGGGEGGIRMFPLTLTDLLTFCFSHRRRELLCFDVCQMLRIDGEEGRARVYPPKATRFPLKFFPVGTCRQLGVNFGGYPTREISARKLIFNVSKFPVTWPSPTEPGFW